tara:strand:- start:726 stop:887 length:162 start_codon:yes stop_codon:yes gene_type:complete
MKEFKNIFNHYSNTTLYGSSGEIRYKYINDDARCIETFFDYDEAMVEERELKK